MNNYPDGSPLGETFNAILSRNDVRPVDDPDEARSLVEAVAAGDSDATYRLLHAVGGTIRSLRSKFRRVPREEFDSAVSIALFEVVSDYDFSDGQTTAAVGSLLYKEALPALTATTTGPMRVPHRTVQRYFSVERAAKREAEALGLDDHRFIAPRIAKEHGMSTDCYLDVRNALASCTVTALQSELEDTGTNVDRIIEKAASRFLAPEVAEDDDELVALAFASVDELEADVCYVAYGFGPEYCPEADDNPRSDAEVGETLGLSNSKAYRTRRRALSKMRDALLAD
jgi:DNA-directed RNA polymerase specialized sigma subunit